MKPKRKVHLAVMALFLIDGIVSYLESCVFITSILHLYDHLEKVAPGKFRYPEHIIDAVNVQYSCLVPIILAYIPYNRFRASVNISPDYHRYKNNGPMKSFLLAIFHENMLYYEFVNLVVYLTLFIFVFCLYAVDSYKPENIWRLAEVFPTPSEEESQLYFRTFKDREKFLWNKSLLVIGKLCLIMEKFAWKNIQYHYGKIKSIATKTSHPKPISIQNT